ncbi:MAG: amino acid adenylation domain-containing protein [Gammaproteobacteria bacterium]|nr:amino acid adenylation domain-containing protein [Gammaproteobacteria bacterium]
MTEVLSAPMSFAQQRLWFLDKLEPGGNQYTMCYVSRLLGELNVSVLGHALESLIGRHESLRTNFTERNGEPVQVVNADLDWEFPVTDLRGLPELEGCAEAEKRVEAARLEPFDLERGPLFRAQLIRESDAGYVLVLAMHHIISDGWSMGVLKRELSALYNAYLEGGGSPLEELAVQYADYAVWQREWLQGKELEAQLGYWKDQLSGLSRLELPMDRPRPAAPTYAGGQHRFSLGRSLTAGLRQLSRDSGVTLFMTLLAAFQVLLHRYSGQEDIVVGIPIAGRNRRDIEGLIGFFVNTLVIRNHINDDTEFSDFLAQVRATLLGSYMNQDLPFEKLVEELKPQRSLNRNPLFDVMFSLQNVPDGLLDLHGLEARSQMLSTPVVKFDFSLNFIERDGELTGRFEYGTELFDHETIVGMSRHLKTLLSNIVHDSQRCIEDLDLMSEEERQRILVDWNRTDTPYPQHLCVHERIEDLTRQAPDAIALVHRDRQMSFRALDERSNQLAHALRERGVGRETIVGVCMERSLEIIVAILGILKAGGAYLPLDPEYPGQRLAIMLDDARPPVLVTGPDAPDLSYSGSVINLIEPGDALGAYSADSLGRCAQPDGLAYVIYTSGSTGRPKGVMIEHRSLMNYVLAANEKFELTARDRALQVASLSFDISVEEIFCCLASGATLVLRDRDTLSGAAQFFSFCDSHSISIVHLPTSYWHELVNDAVSARAPLPASLRLVVIGGEQAGTDYVNQWRRIAGKVRLINSYGPTEATISATFSELSNSDTDEIRRVPIGRPHDNARIYIMDKAMQPVPPGVLGELHIGGTGVARGYLNQPTLTAEKFIADPFSSDPGATLYKTGDIARYRSDAEIEFFGRLDSQIKLRGFRIELGEIAYALRSRDDIRDATVVLRDDLPGGRGLVGYVVPETPGLAFNHVREFLQHILPDHMVPVAFVEVPSIPLTPGGKIDQGALPKPEFEVAAGDAPMALDSASEKSLAEIWEEVLGVKPLSINDNFFTLGGHSLLAIRLVSRISRSLAIEVPLRKVFEKPTLGSFAALLDNLKHDGEASPASAIRSLPRRAADHAAGSAPTASRRR